MGKIGDACTYITYAYVYVPSVCTYVCTYVHVYTMITIDTHIRMYVRTYKYVYTLMYVRTYDSVHVHTYVCTVCTYVGLCLHGVMQIHMYVLILTRWNIPLDSLQATPCRRQLIVGGLMWLLLSYRSLHRRYERLRDVTVFKCVYE